MNDWTIYYNPKCGTCQKTLALLTSKGIKPTVVEYLKNPPVLAELEGLVRKLGISSPLEMMRAKEPVFDEMKLGDGKKSSRDLLRAIVDNPVLLQRPIVVHGAKAVIARPPENVNVLLKS